MKLEEVESTWTRTEDEVLKAGIMKYGTNRWSKVSSLLPSKTPLQCKCRWQEYVDPSLCSGGWGVDEDERLMDVARMFHPQWGLIGQMVGRSGQQCYERYNEIVFGKINVFKYGELSQCSPEEEETEIAQMALERIVEKRSRKDVKREKAAARARRERRQDGGKKDGHV